MSEPNKVYKSKVPQWIINATVELEGELVCGDIGNAPWLESEQNEVRQIIARHAAPAAAQTDAVRELRELREKLQVAFSENDYCPICDNHLSSGHSKSCLARLTAAPRNGNATKETG